MTDAPNTTRRFFLKGLLAVPFIARLGATMPVKPVIILPPKFMRGDLVNTHRSAFRSPYGFIGSRMLERVEGETAFVWNNCYGAGRAVEAVPVAALDLFHGLPGNRVNNPSMRNRLIRDASGFGLSYPEDLRHAV